MLATMLGAILSFRKKGGWILFHATNARGLRKGGVRMHLRLILMLTKTFRREMK